MKSSGFFGKLKENFNLNGVSEVYFWKSEWENFDPQDRLTSISYGFIIYRFAFLAYFILTFTESFLCTSNTERFSYWFLYLTNLTYLIQTLYALFSFATILSAKFKQRKILKKYSTAKNDEIYYSYSPHLPLLEKFTYTLLNITICIPYGVTLFYWVFIFEGNDGDTCSIVSNYFMHAANSVPPIIDSFIIAVPIRISHLLFPMLYGFAYLIFTIIYEVAGGSYEKNDYIYKIIDWGNKPLEAVGYSAATLSLVAIFFIVAGWGFYRLRIIIVNKMKED